MEGEKSKQLKTLFSLVNSDSCSDTRVDSKTNPEGSGCGSAQISESSDTVSSSLSKFSSGEFFQVNPQVLPKSSAVNEIPKPNEDTGQLYDNGKICVPSKAWHRLEQSISDSPESISQFSDLTHESFVPLISPTQFPPIQVMERTGNFDPNGIPCSVFARPSTSIDWSIASNESLFSIHIEEDISSRDHTLRKSDDIHLSGELPKSGELSLSQELCRSGELNQSRELYKSDDLKKSDELFEFRNTNPAAEAVKPNENIDTSKNVSEDMKPGAKAVIDGPISEVPEACINNQSSANLEESSHPCSANPHPAESEIALQSFASLIKEKPPMCHCSYCGGLCCYCKWPTCSINYLSWPSCCSKWSCCSCKCFSRPSCSSKCLSWHICCCKWPNCRNFCKCPSCHFKCPTSSSCPSRPSCKSQSPNCSVSCCSCWNQKPKRSHSSSFYTWMELG